MILEGMKIGYSDNKAYELIHKIKNNYFMHQFLNGKLHELNIDIKFDEIISDDSNILNLIRFNSNQCNSELVDILINIFPDDYKYLNINIVGNSKEIFLSKLPIIQSLHHDNSSMPYLFYMSFSSNLNCVASNDDDVLNKLKTLLNCNQCKNKDNCKTFKNNNNIYQWEEEDCYFKFNDKLLNNKEFLDIVDYFQNKYIDQVDIINYISD